MDKNDEYPKYDVPLTASELYLIGQALERTLAQLGTQRMILLDNGKIASYDALVKQTVEHEMLLAKIRGKEL